MQLSTVPFLLVGLVGLIGWLAHRAERLGAIDRGARRAVWALLVVLIGWAALSAHFAVSGRYLSPAVLAWLPGLWLPLVPMAIVGAGLVVSGGLRRAPFGILDATPPHWLVAVQAVRITALGTLVKTWQGSFPLYFELGVGVPDLLFGASALWVLGAAKRGAIGWRALMLWNLVGFAVVAGPGLPLAQMGLPGPLQVFTGPPASEALYVYPMALAPTVVVPLFLLMNLWAAAWLVARRPVLGAFVPGGSRPTPASPR